MPAACILPNHRHAWDSLFACVACVLIAFQMCFALEAASVARPSQDVVAALPPARCAESAYKCGVQVCFTLVLLLVGLNKPWFYDTKLYWADCRWPCDMPISYGERFVYCLVLGFYVQVGGLGGRVGGWVGGWVGGRGTGMG